MTNKFFILAGILACWSLLEQIQSTELMNYSMLLVLLSVLCFARHLFSELTVKRATVYTYYYTAFLFCIHAVIASILHSWKKEAFVVMSFTFLFLGFLLEETK